MTKTRATLIGLIAVVLWSSIVALLRGVAEAMGPSAGAALIFTVGSILLRLTVGIPPRRASPRAYLFAGGLSFVAYELCLALSLGYATSSRQAIEVSLVNYLWPSLTILFAVAFNKQKSTVWIVPGVLLAFMGVWWAQGGAQGLGLAATMANIRGNPLSYGLAFAGALIWATYCTVTARMANGASQVTLFFALTALAFWIKFLVGGDTVMHLDWSVAVQIVLAGAAMGFGYAAWNFGILHGNIAVLAVASYFIPIFSSALAAVLLSAPLAAGYWNGAAMVCAGSLMCWWATRSRSRHRRTGSVERTGSGG
ncbi:aromatic amino acid DMT transporter YddG [Bordetella genomosp. 11]|uniref:EamA family transporter n=1 Tax=Bordetella genomosp. 11 TaxID=1416808 RepID=A0A261UZ61_9BORD|nr:aromatic amino acid DMT transporter YddG [Bordetella genomosp. 11]OZI66642.1 EamA family transporter [Bordetella genomosp. 11]